MPVINAFADHPTHPYVRVQADWADVPSVTHAAAYRVDAETGECTPLRPYICYDGWELLLSCGHGTWWDTEAPFDRPFYYITTSEQAPCVPQTTLIYDTYGRVLVDSWGSTEGGTLGPLAYTNVGGTVPGNYDVNGVAGTHTLDSTNVFRYSTVDSGSPTFDVYAVTSVPAVATGAPFTNAVVGRFTDTNNLYFGRVAFGLLGVPVLQIARLVGGVGALVDQVTLVPTYSANEQWTIRFSGNGTLLQAKAWPTASPEPADWMLTTVDTTLTVGTRIGVASRRDNLNTNGTSIVSWYDLLAVNECADCEPVTATAPTEITLASDGRFWLKNPTRPCDDRPVPLCPMDGRPVVCGGTGGILFIGMGPEIYAANSYSLRPMNRRRNISVTRPRSDATTALRLQTMTFTDRDELLALTAPGSPLLWQGPAEYGIPDRYLDVKDVQVSPELPDLRIQIRSEVLPYDTVDRPAGPTTGICGARVADICANYPTWNDLAATGMTWDNLVAGQASPESANPNLRTWDDVQAEFADWDAVSAGGRTWNELQAGD